MVEGTVVPLAFDIGLVALSYVIAALGAYVALLAATHIRLEDGVGVRLSYVGIAAFALGGIAIWSMHFIGMQAQEMPFVVGYRVGYTVLSLIVAVGFSGLALWYVGRARFSGIRCLIGGAIAGVGVAAMHYIGMAAMRMPAEVQWHPVLIVVSVAIAVVAAAAALWLAFHVQSIVQRGLAALVMAGAVCGMHYTGAAAAMVICTAPRATDAWDLSGLSLPYMTFLVSALVLIAMRWQLQRSSQDFRAHLAARVDALIDTAAIPPAADLIADRKNA